MKHQMPSLYVALVRTCKSVLTANILYQHINRRYNGRQIYTSHQKNSLKLNLMTTIMVFNTLQVKHLRRLLIHYITIENYEHQTERTYNIDSIVNYYSGITENRVPRMFPGAEVSYSPLCNNQNSD